MSDAVAAMLAPLFDFDVRGRDRFRAAPSHSAMPRLYGGQVVAQALEAAQRTVEGKLAHSCHAYFVRAGDPALPLDFAVSRDSDGRSFAARRVTVRQARRLVLSLSASFQIEEGGPGYQAAMPDVPPPEDLPTQSQLTAAVADRLPARLRGFWLSEPAVEYRPCEPIRYFSHAPEAPVRRVWFRLRTPLPDDPRIHRRMLAYASDLHILHVAMLPIGIGFADAAVRTASLDHSLWFHDHARADDWLLYDLEGDFAGHARALGRGRIFARDGRLVASAAQEGLVRTLASATS